MFGNGGLPVRKHVLLFYCDLIIILPETATLVYVSMFVLLYINKEVVVFGMGYDHFHCHVRDYNSHMRSNFAQ
jgi:hypothetical protein